LVLAGERHKWACFWQFPLLARKMELARGLLLPPALQHPLASSSSLTPPALLLSYPEASLKGLPTDLGLEHPHFLLRAALGGVVLHRAGLQTTTASVGHKLAKQPSVAPRWPAKDWLDEGHSGYGRMDRQMPLDHTGARVLSLASFRLSYY
jgi:hypothetical protein